MQQLREYAREAAAAGKNFPASTGLMNWDHVKPGQSSKSNTVYAAQLQDNPYGCYGQTDNPHRSTHTGGLTINVVARTKCDVAVPEISVTTQLYKRDCPWPWCGWSVYNNAPPGTDTQFNAALAETNSAAPPCINQEYKGTSSHYIYGADGNFYWAITQNAHTVTNC